MFARLYGTRQQIASINLRDNRHSYLGCNPIINSARFKSMASNPLAQLEGNKMKHYTPRHAGPVCTEQADYIQDLVAALEDAQSWASDAESAAQSAHGAIESALKESGLW